MFIRSQRDFWSGIMFVAIGATFGILALQYRMGTAGEMGPGWFPMALSILLTLLGLAIAFNALSRHAPETRLDKVEWREVLLILASVAVFAFVLPYLGVIVSVALLVLIAAAADRAFRLREILGLIAVLLLMTYFVFVRGLDIQFPVWPTIIGG